MPPKKQHAAEATAPSTACHHNVLYIGESHHAEALSFYRPHKKTDLLSALTRSNKPSETEKSRKLPPSSTFPTINLLPQDALDLDPNEPPQPLHDYISGRRNRISRTRKVVYVVDVPSVDPKASTIMHGWTDPIIPKEHENTLPVTALELDRPGVDDISGYLQAFYAGLAVKTLKNQFCFAPWTRDKPHRGRGYIALTGPDGSSTRIRFRMSPDGVTAGQLNLNDMLDALQAAVPPDAYAILLLTDHDMYEDEQDDFCAGRAYGGSRICTVSSFRYNPALDAHAGINHAHSWPASHCRDFVDETWEKNEPALKDTDYGRSRARKSGAKIDAERMIMVDKSAQTPLAAAVMASRQVLVPKMKEEWSGAWLTRVCRTASHELGHCFGLAHCTHYACAMQGTASVEEDMRQPPYLCPVCLAKLGYTIAGEAVVKSRGGEAESYAAEAAWVVESYRQMRAFCRARGGVGMFAGLNAWLTARLVELSATEDALVSDGDEDIGHDSSVLYLGSAPCRA